MKDHEIALLVNELVSVCEMFHDTQQLRQHIANTVNKALNKSENQELAKIYHEQVSQLKQIGLLNKDVQRLMDRVSSKEHQTDTSVKKLICDTIRLGDRINILEQRIDTDLVETRRSADNHHQRLIVLEMLDDAKS